MSNGPFGGGPFGGNPTTGTSGMCCPKCRAKDWDAYTNQYATVRTCRKCKQQWSGGTMGAARPDFSEPAPPPGIAAPEDRPVVQFTGAGFRDPSKNSDGV